jgi:hypothetical protein
MIFLLLLSCAFGTHDTGEVYGFSDQWLQFDKYFQNKCFYLDSNTHNVFIYEDGDNEIEEKSWHWEFFPPHLFIIDENDLMVYENEPCWDLEAYGLTAQVCECAITIPE